MTNLVDNNLLLYGLISGTVCLISGYYIKSKYYSIVIETPNSPPTYNVTLGEIQELNRLASGETTPTNSVTHGDIQEVNEILGSGQTTPTNSVTHGQIQDINSLMDRAETNNPVYFFSEVEFLAMKEKLQTKSGGAFI